MLARVILLLLVSTSAMAYRRAEVDNVPRRYLYWPNRTLSYAINRNGCKDALINEAVKAIQRSFFTWASPSCTDLYFLYDGLVDTQKTNLTLGQNEAPDHRNLLIWHNTWPPPGVTDSSVTEKMPAVTTVIYSTETGAIIDADVDLNAKNFFWTTTDDASWAATDIQNIVTHELGHLLGLAHSTELEATMFDTTHQGELDKRTLHADDELGICKVYPFDHVTPKGEGQGQVPQEVQGGCWLVATGGPPVEQLLLLLLLLLPVVMWRLRSAARAD